MVHTSVCEDVCEDVRMYVSVRGCGIVVHPRISPLDAPIDYPSAMYPVEHYVSDLSEIDHHSQGIAVHVRQGPSSNALAQDRHICLECLFTSDAERRLSFSVREVPLQ